MRHMRPYQMSRRQRGIERELTGQNRSSNDASEQACVVTWGCRMCAADAQEVQHSGLGL
jgi:hypothetical protein